MSILDQPDLDINHMLEVVTTIKSEIEVLMTLGEMHDLYKAVKYTADIVGDIAEVGVYKGGSAKVICEAMGNKTLYLFDTFSGLPPLGQEDIDGNVFTEGDYAVSVEEVTEYLKEYDVRISVGEFSTTNCEVNNIRFSLVNIDVDLVKSIIDCLEFFYPRVNNGGIILVHDYMDFYEVYKIVNKFYQYKPELRIELANQHMIIKGTTGYEKEKLRLDEIINGDLSNFEALRLRLQIDQNVLLRQLVNKFPDIEVN